MPLSLCGKLDEQQSSQISFKLDTFWRMSKQLKLFPLLLPL